MTLDLKDEATRKKVYDTLVTAIREGAWDYSEPALKQEFNSSQLLSRGWFQSTTKGLSVIGVLLAAAFFIWSLSSSIPSFQVAVIVVLFLSMPALSFVMARPIQAKADQFEAHAQKLESGGIKPKSRAIL